LSHHGTVEPEVARGNVTGLPQWESTADGSREAGEAEEIDISAHVGLLETGDNVLAIVGLNRSTDSSDFSLIPELLLGSGTAAGGGCGEVAYATGSIVTLGGRAPAARARRVEINGVEAFYDGQWGRWEGVVDLSPGENLVEVKAFDGDDRLLEAAELLIHRVGAFSALMQVR